MKTREPIVQLIARKAGRGLANGRIWFDGLWMMWKAHSWRVRFAPWGFHAPSLPPWDPVKKAGLKWGLGFWKPPLPNCVNKKIIWDMQNCGDIRRQSCPKTYLAYPYYLPFHPSFLPFDWAYLPLECYPLVNCPWCSFHRQQSWVQT